MAAAHKELEVKFYLTDLERVKTTLEGIGAILIQPRTYEQNLRFDTPEGLLTQNAQVLRLRVDAANRLTYKGPGEVKDGVSARREIEFTVDDFDNAKAMLEVLGYQVSMIYEKYRTVYEFSDTLVTLDEMPFGSFAEIEGPDGVSIQKMCNELGFLWELRTLQSYAMLFHVVKTNLNLPFRDLTFENFAEIKVSPSHLELAPTDLTS